MKLLRPRRPRLAALAASLALLVPAAVPAAAQSAAQSTAPALSLDGLKAEIGNSLRFLRTQQDVKTGAYGDLETTALAVRAFAESPWAYRPGDGPFVALGLEHLLGAQRKDGAIAAPDAKEPEAHATTKAASAALASLKDAPGVAQALQRAQVFESGADTAGPLPAFAGADDAAQLSGAGAALARRAPDGSWSSDRGAAHATAAELVRLDRLHAELSARAKSAAKPAPKTAHPLPPFTAADRKQAETAMRRGAAFLAGAAEGGRFGFPGRPDPGITAMVIGGLLATPEPRDPAVAKLIDGGLDWLVMLQHEDGSIHQGQVGNYVTSAAVMALVRAGRPGDAPVIAKARAFLQNLQADEGEGYQPGDRYYGGVGYGSSERPDLSNLQMALDALSAAGAEPGDPTLQKAVLFLQRCQNRSESNDVVLVDGAKTIKSGDDGGSAYAPGDSKAGNIKLPDGTEVPRSYGSMTYALLKGYLLAGLPKEDPRVEAAWGWLRKNYTLEVNPGFETSSDPAAAYQGLFYYFHTMARALDLYGDEAVEDASGTAHAWRGELVGRLIALQRQDGSWINENAERWYEGNPVLATAYALLALDEALPPTAATPASAPGGKK